MRSIALSLAVFAFSMVAYGEELPLVTAVEYQPLAAQVVRLMDALAMVGEPLPAAEAARLKRLASETTDPKQAALELQGILDQHCLVGVTIDPESRVKVRQGPSQPELVEQGWRTFLVNLHMQVANACLCNSCWESRDTS